MSKKGILCRHMSHAHAQSARKLPLCPRYTPIGGKNLCASHNNLDSCEYGEKHINPERFASG